MKQGVNDKVCSGMIALVKVQATKTVRKKTKKKSGFARARGIARSVQIGRVRVAARRAH
jgi:hypothetical protein